MTQETDITASLRESVLHAADHHRPLSINGRGTKAFYGRRVVGQELSVAEHRGIVSYEPTELVITARCGTPLAEVQAALADQGQMLAFEPPLFGPDATLGGTVAAGLSGPRRPYSGATRDFVLGTRILNGKGQVLSFGGQVMKNVAGYDVSRLMTGAQGTLGILLEISLKVLPVPPIEITLAFEMDDVAALQTCNSWAGQPVPLSAACYDGKRLYIRLSGTESGVHTARRSLGGETAEGEFWNELREHLLPFFKSGGALWRLSVPPGAPLLNLPGEWILDWGGAQRWLRSDANADSIRRHAEKAGGHATLFRGDNQSEDVFHPLSKNLMRLQKQLKSAFDPNGIFNPGRLYPEL